jgi:hypothetical protein
MIPSFWRDTITRVRAPLVTDEYGTLSTERDWAHGVETAIANCSVQPVTSKEYDAGREAVTIRWRIFAPAGTDLLASDRVRFSSVLYELDGDGQAWPSATGGIDHVEALMKRVVG